MKRREVIKVSRYTVLGIFVASNIFLALCAFFMTRAFTEDGEMMVPGILSLFAWFGLTMSLQVFKAD